MEQSKAFVAILAVVKSPPSSLLIAVVRVLIIWFCSDESRSFCCSSSQTNPSAWRDACLICSCWCVALQHRMLTSSSHSFRGISIAAIVATKFATWVLTLAL